MDGRDGTREDTQDTTRLVEIEELKRAIRVLLFVTKLSRVDAHKDKAAGGGYPQMRFLPWLLWKEARGTSSSLQRAPNGARMLAGAAEATAGSSCRLR